MRKGILITYMLLWIQWGVFAANFVTTNNFNTEKGLGQNSVQSIIQDANGFIWLATKDGLNRFDGNSYKILNVSEFDVFGYQSNDFTCLMLDTASNVWFGTKAGIYSHSSKTEKITTYRIHATPENPRGNRVEVRSILQRQNGDVLMLSQFGLFQLKNSVFHEITSFDRISESAIVQLNCFIEDEIGILWIGTSEGLFYLDDQDMKLKSMHFPGLDKLPVDRILELSSGELMIASMSNIYMIDPVNDETYPLEFGDDVNLSRITTLFQDSNHNIWIGTATGGLYQMSAKADKLLYVYNESNELLKSNVIASVYEDEYGLLWVGTADKGVFTLDKNQQMIRRLGNQKYHDAAYVKSIEKVIGTNNKIWIATADKGVILADYSDFENVKFTKPVSDAKVLLKSNTINDILAVGKYLYLATEDKGFHRVVVNGDKWMTSKNYMVLDNSLGSEIHDANNLIAGKDGNVWFTNSIYGLCYFDTQKELLRQLDIDSFEKLCANQNSSENKSTSHDFNIKNLNISTIIASSTNDFWIGTNGGGLYKLIFQSDGNYKLLLVEEQITSNLFMNCMLEENNFLWIGTQSMGLYQMNLNTGVFEKYGQQSGLANEVIHSIEKDAKGVLWVSTNKGISRFEHGKNMFLNYTRSTYLQDYEFNDRASLNHNGILFFGGNYGINYFKVQDRISDASVPKVQISELLINNQPIVPGVTYGKRKYLTEAIYNTKRIDIYHTDKVFSLAISPLYFADPANNTFYYKLEPFEKEWVERSMTNRYVTYNNLKGGTYRFWVKAKNSDGVFSEEKSVIIRVHPPLWEQGWFLVLLYFLSFCLIGVLFGFRYYNQKNRHHQVEHERNMMQSLIDNIPDTIYFKDLQSNFTRVNKAQAKLLGYDNPAEVIGKSDFDFYDNAEETYQIEQEIIRTGVPVVNKLHKHVVSGKTRYFSDTKIAIHDKAKRCIGTVGVSRDITDLKFAEEAMLESQAKFKALFDNAPLAIFRIDKDQHIVEFNHRFRKMFGYSQTSDLTHLVTGDLLVDSDIGKLIFETVLETREISTEIMLKRVDGETFIANLTLALLEEGFKEVTIEGIIEDITQMAQARDEIIKAKDKAVEADKLKSLFLANMSHEIRTPMNAIIGFTNMLREESLSMEDRNSFIDVIQSNGNNLVTLIDSIVDFSKLEAEQMSVSMSEFNLNPLFDTICDHAEKLLISEGKDSVKLIRSKGSEEPVRIISDRHRLSQVFNHLISNAIKFCDEGEIEIGYHVNHENISMFVRDTGIGISKNKHEYIFQRFAKVEDKNRLYGGTGIGLTISKGLIELMGGSISVDSELGVGSTFVLKMPVTNKMDK